MTPEKHKQDEPRPPSKPYSSPQVHVYGDILHRTRTSARHLGQDSKAKGMSSMFFASGI
jgi:hypothetical protein